MKILLCLLLSTGKVLCLGDSLMAETIAVLRMAVAVNIAGLEER